MIRGMRRKLNNQNGASLLLALLFLLICVMVSASILMASVSNAGKHSSNLEEHQTYLALSSAVSLLCDELNRTEYCGQYSYWETEQTITNPDDGTESTVTLRHFKQLNGAYEQIGTGKNGYLDFVLSSDFDAIFAEEIQKKLDHGNGFQTFQVKSGAVLPHHLTITPELGSHQTQISLDESEIGIKLNVVEKSCAIELTAVLGDYQICAELTPTTNKPTLPVTLSEGKQQKSEPLRWEIGWITVGDKEAER